MTLFWSPPTNKSERVSSSNVVLFHRICEIGAWWYPFEYFHLHFVHFCTYIFSHVPHVYIIVCSLIFCNKGWWKPIITIKAFCPLKVASNYAIKQNSKLFVCIKRRSRQLFLSGTVSNIVQREINCCKSSS